MLQTIREHTQGWIAGTIITLIILSFALWGIHSYFVSGEGNSNVAEVNGTDITKEQLAVAYERMRRQEQVQHTSNMPVTAKDEAALKQRALQALIDIEVLKQASTAQGFRISDGQIDNYLQSMQEFQVNGQFSIERFQELLATTLLSTSEFLDLIRISLLIEQPKLGIILTSFALPDETNYTIALVNQTRDVEYINIPMHYFLSQSITISSDKIKTYYDQHHGEFMTPEQVNVEYIELSLKDLSNMINPTDTMLKSFYNENINSYTHPMQWKIVTVQISLPASPTQDEVAEARRKTDILWQALKASQDISNIAAANSAIVKTFDWLTLNQVPTEFQKAVATLTKAGQVAEPYRADKGFVIVKAIDMREPKIQPFETVQNKVKEVYVHQLAEEKFADLRDKLASMTYEHPESLQGAAKQLSLPIKTSELFAREKVGKDISQYKKVRDTAFSSDVLTLQNNSDVIQLNPETVIVLRVKSHVASTLLPLSAISKQIEDKLKAEAAEKNGEKFVNELKIKLQAGADPVQLANSYKFTWHKTGLIGRYSTKVDNAILDLAFRLPNPAITQGNPSYGATRLPNGYAIVALKAVKEGTVSDQRQYSVFSEQIQSSEGVLEYELYKLSQVKQSKVQVLQ